MQVIFFPWLEKPSHNFVCGAGGEKDRKSHAPISLLKVLCVPASASAKLGVFSKCTRCCTEEAFLLCDLYSKVIFREDNQQCESCVELLFVRGAGNCHECDTPLRKSNFRVQLFEDPAVDKEVEIRKKVLKIYNKREEDFPSLDEYNDFLEEIEEIVFNLTNNVDLENTKKKMELYQKDNKEVIQKNKLKLTREQEELEEALEVERQESEQRRLFIQKEEQLQQMIKRKNKQALLDDLESSDLPASLLLAQHKDRSTQLEMQLEKPKPVKPVTFSTGIKMGQHISLAPIQKLEETLYEYQPLQVETYGPQVPELEMLGRLGYLTHVRAASPQDLAGGYTSSLACHRALQDAFSGLFWHPS
ncbi:PREDICTED: CDK-activating kinase assembly factor MAT1 [Lepidothrix coronata]|uniref:CDK-activating kinase assembly factor MAT1 n=2 Tax=Pipridae TaxID=114313 RepID=A0A6J0GM82_9PASS|nr:PREDICTED: CDK-activating kinase assembly factor MAT1 [Lepidothrix coronata]